MTALRIPYAFRPEHNRVLWIDRGDERFTEPFFRDSINRMRWAGNTKAESALEELLSHPTQNAISVPVQLLVFHVSRCGSTLLSQMLASTGASQVLSEPMILSDLLMSDLPYDQKIRAVQTVMHLFGQNRPAGERYLVVKPDSWLLLHTDLLRRAFPDARMLFLFREPGEVLRSHLRVRGTQMVPGLLPVNLAEQTNNLDAYAAGVLETIYRLMARHYRPGDLLIEYPSIVPLFEHIVQHAGMEFSIEELQTMRRRSQYDSKQPGETFPAQVGAGEERAVSLVSGRLRETYLELVSRAVSNARDIHA